MTDFSLIDRSPTMVDTLREIIEVLVLTHELEEVAVGDVTYRLGRSAGEIVRNILECGA